MQKTIIALAAVAILWSCDYSTKSNGNIDDAYAREPKASAAHDADIHGSTDAASHEAHNTPDAHNSEHHPSTDSTEAVKEHEAHH